MIHSWYVLIFFWFEFFHRCDFGSNFIWLIVRRRPLYILFLLMTCRYLLLNLLCSRKIGFGHGFDTEMISPLFHSWYSVVFNRQTTSLNTGRIDLDENMETRNSFIEIQLNMLRNSAVISNFLTHSSLYHPIHRFTFMTTRAICWLSEF